MVYEEKLAYKAVNVAYEFKEALCLLIFVECKLSSYW